MDTTFSTGDKVLIWNVDNWGFQGRDDHPTQAHEGLVGEVVRVEHFDEEEDFLVEGDCNYTLLRVLTLGAHPVYLDLISHEVVKVKVELTQASDSRCPSPASVVW